MQYNKGNSFTLMFGRRRDAVPHMWPIGFTTPSCTPPPRLLPLHPRVPDVHNQCFFTKTLANRFTFMDSLHQNSCP